MGRISHRTDCGLCFFLFLWLIMFLSLRVLWCVFPFMLTFIMINETTCLDNLANSEKAEPCIALLLKQLTLLKMFR